MLGRDLRATSEEFLDFILEGLHDDLNRGIVSGTLARSRRVAGDSKELPPEK